MIQEFNKDKIIVIDFGSQVTKLIARRIREEEIFCQILKVKDLKKKNFKKYQRNNFIWWTSNCNQKNFPKIPNHIFNSKIPILGICYGLQLIAKHFKGKIKLGKNKREFGKMIINKNLNSDLTKNFIKIINL